MGNFEPLKIGQLGEIYLPSTATVCFDVTLICIDEAVIVDRSKTPREQITAEIGMTPLIMVVEDEDTTRALIVKILTRAKYDVVEASTGQECINYFTAGKPHPQLVLLDVMMPELSGIDVLQKLKFSPSTANVGVVMLTSVSNSEMVKTAYKYGATDYLVKPVQTKFLLERVRFNIPLHIEKHDLPLLFEQLRFEEPGLLRSHGLRALLAEKVRCYPIQYRNTPLCVVLPEDIPPKRFANQKVEELESRVRVFMRNASRWILLWPSRRSKIEAEIERQRIVRAELAKESSIIAEVAPEDSVLSAMDGWDNMDALNLSLSSRMRSPLSEIMAIRFSSLEDVDVGFWKMFVKLSAEKEKCKFEVEKWRAIFQQQLFQMRGSS